MNDTLGGVVPVIYADMVSALPHIRSGRLRALAVGTPQRVKALDGVQTMAEQGFGGYEASSWGGLVAPRDTPRAIIDKLSRSEEHTSELQSQSNLVCRLLLEKKNGRTEQANGKR